MSLIQNKRLLKKNHNLLLDEVGYIIEQVLWEHPRPFPLMDFQKLALHQIGSLNNVILVNLTGSGKMLVFVNFRPADGGVYFNKCQRCEMILAKSP